MAGDGGAADIDGHAALVEFAYLTNPEQAAEAGREEFKNSVAESLYDAIVRFRTYVEGQVAQ